VRPDDDRERNVTDCDGLSTAENDLLHRNTMFGSAMYPVRRQGRHWIWEGTGAPPTVFATKRAAVAHFELYMDILRDKAAGRL
jgi:hypothetical protein